METLIPNVNSMMSMRLAFDKKYTTRSKKPSLKALILLTKYSPSSLEQFIQENERLSKKYRIKVESIESDLSKLYVEKEIRGRLVSGEAIVHSKQEGCLIAYTDEKDYFVKHVLETLFNDLYPDVLRVYFNYKQIKRFFEAVKDKCSGSSILTHISIGIRKETKRSKSKLLLWEFGAEDELEKQAKNYRIWIDYLDFEIKDKNDRILLQGSLTNKGLIRLKFGEFSYFQESLISLFLELAFRWQRFFSERERHVEEGKIKLSPYAISYPADIDEKQILELEKGISSFYSYSVIHGGNPYFVVNLSDYIDGSSFGLTILDNTITITPMLFSTAYGLWKLSHRIQRIIGEGEIRNI